MAHCQTKTDDFTGMRIKGVFSAEAAADQEGPNCGCAQAARRVYYHAEEADDGTVVIQQINVNNVPSGPKQGVERDHFLRSFFPEPEFYLSTVSPSMRALSEQVERGEAHRGHGESYSAEVEFDGALRVDEEHVRANFGLGLTYLGRGDTAKAEDVFQRLVALDAAFGAEHKHLFNEFGISLRKNGMYHHALEYYARAVELATDDEHLRLNIARAHFERGDIDSCMTNLGDCLELNPHLTEAKRFLNYLYGNGYAQGEPLDIPPQPTQEQEEAERAQRMDFPTAEEDASILDIGFLGNGLDLESGTP